MRSKEKIVVSIIIVRYRVVKELFACLDSIKKLKDKTSFEVILVDNDVQRPVEKEIHKNYKWVTYIKAPKNLGFGPGNNLGAKYAKGEYLFFLNSDTTISQGAIDALVDFMDKHKKAGMVSPLLLDQNKKVYKLQGTRILTPIRALFSLSFIHKLLPNNPISKKYYMVGWDKTKVTEVDIIPGTAPMIRRKLFDELAGWDEHFFIYFEEFDICKRAREKGYKIFIIPQSQVVHLWEKSTTPEKSFFLKIFKQSRFFYFRKHFGLLTAFFMEGFLRIDKYIGLLFLILVIAAILLFYNLAALMPFIGDQGWFYLSARDMVLYGQIPLVGITSSHVWLHQGPYWTYMLGGLLWLFHFNPIPPAYFTAIIGLITVYLVYKLGSEIFSRRIGLIASLIYATSPLIVLNGRMAYHSSFIAILTLILFYAVYKWIQGFRYGFPLIIFLLAFLYNFETATFMFFPVVLLIILYGIYKKTQWVKTIWNKKMLLLSFFAWLIPMIPMILYDTHHGYPQTIKFAEWVIYKIATVFGFPKIHPNAPGESWQSMWPFASQQVQELVFLKNAVASWIILAIGFVNLLFIDKEYFKKREYLQPYSLLTLFFFIPAVLYIAEKTNAGAYWNVFFPTICFMIALIFERIIQIRNFSLAGIVLLLFFVVLNITTFFQSDFLVNPTGYGFSMTQRMFAAKQIISESQGKEYNLVGKGFWSQFASFTMNYEYLTWWMGHGPSHSSQPLRFVIQEMPTEIVVTKQVNGLTR